MPIIAKIIENIINPLIYLLFALGLVYFLFGMFQFIMAGDDTGKHENGRQHMIWGIIGLAIMVGVYGLLNIINGTIASLMS